MRAKDIKINMLCDALRLRRAELDMPYREISQRLKIKESYIEAIEQGAIEKLPSKSCFIGYAKVYSELLQLRDFDDLWEQLKPINENFKIAPQEVTSNRYLLPSNTTLFISGVLSIGIFCISYFLL